MCKPFALSNPHVSRYRAALRLLSFEPDTFLRHCLCKHADPNTAYYLKLCQHGNPSPRPREWVTSFQGSQRLQTRAYLAVEHVPVERNKAWTTVHA